MTIDQINLSISRMQLDRHFTISLFHIFLVVPLLLFVGFQRASTPLWLYYALMGIATVVFLYHGARFLIRFKNKSSLAYINAIHIILVAPLLFYIGYHGKNTPRFAYELLLMLAFGALGYHIFSLVRLVEMHPEPQQ